MYRRGTPRRAQKGTLLSEKPSPHVRHLLFVPLCSLFDIDEPLFHLFVRQHNVFSHFARRRDEFFAGASWSRTFFEKCTAFCTFMDFRQFCAIQYQFAICVGFKLLFRQYETVTKVCQHGVRSLYMMEQLQDNYNNNYKVIYVESGNDRRAALILNMLKSLKNIFFILYSNFTRHCFFIISALL